MPVSKEALTTDMKQDANIDLDEFETQAENLVNDLHSLSHEWEELRENRTGAELVTMLGTAIVDILDSIARIGTCGEDECPELCHEDWDFCEKHGSKKS